MIQSINKKRAVWLFVVSGMIVAMIVLGGLVRLTGSGLSITDWDVITGVVPPLSEADWAAAFDEYKETPQYQQVNLGMPLSAFKFIYWMEYLHRLLGRIVGAVYAVPVLWWLATRRLWGREAWPYVWIGLGFAFQGWLGWYMVQSGLVNRPSVSHFRLTAHLLSALALLGLTFWVALDNLQGRGRGGDRRLRRIALAALAAFALQTTYGGLMAGLKAGYVSSTWPLMFDALVPAAMMSTLGSVLENLVSNPVTVHFIHRWLAWLVVGLVGWLWVEAGLGRPSAASLKTAHWLLALVCIQVLLGISTVLFVVPPVLASLHQAAAIGIFLGLLGFLHRLRTGTIRQPHTPG